MTNLDLYSLVSSAAPLIALLFLAKGTFGSEPRCEKGRRIEAALKVTNDLRRGD